MGGQQRWGRAAGDQRPSTSGQGARACVPAAALPELTACDDVQCRAADLQRCGLLAPASLVQALHTTTRYQPATSGRGCRWVRGGCSSGRWAGGCAHRQAVVSSWRSWRVPTPRPLSLGCCMAGGAGGHRVHVGPAQQHVGGGARGHGAPPALGPQLRGHRERGQRAQRWPARLGRLAEQAGLQSRCGVCTSWHTVAWQACGSGLHLGCHAPPCVPPWQGCGLPWDRPDIGYKPHFAANYLAFYGERRQGAGERRGWAGWPRGPGRWALRSTALPVVTAGDGPDKSRCPQACLPSTPRARRAQGGAPAPAPHCQLRGAAGGGAHRCVGVPREEGCVCMCVCACAC